MHDSDGPRKIEPVIVDPGIFQDLDASWSWWTRFVSGLQRLNRPASVGAFSAILGVLWMTKAQAQDTPVVVFALICITVMGLFSEWMKFYANRQKGEAASSHASPNEKAA